MFIDEVKIRVKAGDGGNGCLAFRREKYVPRGGPSGGDGGHGGDVILYASEHYNTLLHFRFNPEHKAERGRHGEGSNRTGRDGASVELPVPVGTIAYDAETGDLLHDFTQPEERFLVARGGRGGRGNARFATSTHQAPTEHEPGKPGEERHLRLELKLLADVGLVGFPNAGKSTLISRISAAHPKIADYPFTTLEPHLGVVRLDDLRSFVVADIPGLIEGAHRGEGLGHDFLRHIQRTRVLIHLLDGLAEAPLLDLAQINTELALFDPALGDKPQIVVLNKMDLPEVQEKWDALKKQLKAKGYQNLYSISAITKQGLQPVLYRAAELLEELPAYEYRIPLDDEEMPVYRYQKDPQDYLILKTDRGWRVTGQAIERAASMTYWEHFQSIRRFQRILETMGVDQALRDAGIQPGDTVLIGDHELEWEE